VLAITHSHAALQPGNQSGEEVPTPGNCVSDAFCTIEVDFFGRDESRHTIFFVSGNMLGAGHPPTSATRISSPRCAIPTGTGSVQGLLAMKERRVLGKKNQPHSHRAASTAITNMPPIISAMPSGPRTPSRSLRISVDVHTLNQPRDRPEMPPRSDGFSNGGEIVQRAAESSAGFSLC
jgi:hypothetical protein